ncbi:MAG: hypothetical protein FWD67_08835 [Betaproteobacteria bacterium]|nr:hypothetical protein [Betaproteobacteria bacterium]
MKYLAVFLLIECLASPTWGAEPAMTLEEFVQDLEKAKPWTREKVEALFGSKFTRTSSTGVVTLHTMLGSLSYGKEIIFNQISFQVSATTDEALYVKATLDDNSGCFTWEQIKKSYPGGYVDFQDVPYGGEVYYIKKQTEGELLFGFNRDEKGECLKNISIQTNLFLDIEK